MALMAPAPHLLNNVARVMLLLMPQLPPSQVALLFLREFTRKAPLILHIPRVLPLKFQVESIYPMLSVPAAQK